MNIGKKVFRQAHRPMVVISRTIRNCCHETASHDFRNNKNYITQLGEENPSTKQTEVQRDRSEATRSGATMIKRISLRTHDPLKRTSIAAGNLDLHFPGSSCPSSCLKHA